MLSQLHAFLQAAVKRGTGLASPRYQPELHYMRGRGPACARHDWATSKSDAARQAQRNAKNREQMK
jgi:hypothetical protein